MLAVVPSRLVLVLFRYAQPILISRTISFVSQPVAIAEGDDKGSDLIIATFIIYTGLAVWLVLLSHYMRKPANPPCRLLWSFTSTG